VVIKKKFNTKNVCTTGFFFVVHGARRTLQSRHGSFFELGNFGTGDRGCRHGHQKSTGHGHGRTASGQELLQRRAHVH